MNLPRIFGTSLFNLGMKFLKKTYESLEVDPFNDTDAPHAAIVHPDAVVAGFPIKTSALVHRIPYDIPELFFFDSTSHLTSSDNDRLAAAMPSSCS